MMDTNRWLKDNGIMKPVGSPSKVSFLIAVLLVLACVGIVSAIPPMGDLVRNTTNLTITTYDGSGQLTHPCVIYADPAWNGYTYLMAETPYPGTNASYENPSMRYSNDKITWTTIPGQPDPIINPPVVGFLSDVNIELKSGVLYLFYRYADSDTPTVIYYNYTTTTDGVTWTDPVTIDIPGPRSGSFLWNGTSWNGWVHNLTSGNLKHYSSSDIVHWTESGMISEIDIGAYSQWHSEIKLYESQYQMLLLPTSYDRLFYFNSTDGVSWVGTGNPVLIGSGNGNWDQKLYKSSFTYKNSNFDIWYAGWKVATPNVWYIGYTNYTAYFKPISDFIGSPTYGVSPLPVTFTDLSQNKPTIWAWFFGDEAYTQPWIDITGNPGWAGRAGQATTTLPDNTIILLGGYDGSNYKNDTWKSDDGGVTWTLQNASSGWGSRNFPGLTSQSNGDLILAGGVFGTDYYNDTWISSDKGVTWTLQNASSVWSKRYGSLLVTTSDDTLVLIGGGDATTFANDAWVSLNKGATWSIINSSIWSYGRTTFSGGILPNDHIVVTGGNLGGAYANDTWVSSNKGSTWTLQNASSGWTKRIWNSDVAMPDNSIVLMGGLASTTYMNDVWRSTDEGVTWTRVNASAGWLPRSRLTSSLMSDGSIRIFGGFTSTSVRSNETWSMSPQGSNIQNPAHTYTGITGQAFNVSLFASNPAGSDSEVKNGYITITNITAQFIPTTPHIWYPHGITFTDTSTGIPTVWNWSFGDGNYSALQNPSHYWPSPAIYNVTLNASTAYAYSINSTLIEVGLANFTATPLSGLRRLTVSFTDTSTNATAWSWSFGDSSISTQQNPSHTYNTKGLYTVNLTAYSPDDSITVTKTGYIDVGEPNVPCDNGMSNVALALTVAGFMLLGIAVIFIITKFKSVSNSRYANDSTIGEFAIVIIIIIAGGILLLLAAWISSLIAGAGVC